MPQENENLEGALEMVPTMRLAQLKFEVAHKVAGRDKAAAKEIMEAVKADNMTPFYLECCRDLPSFKVIDYRPPLDEKNA